MSTLHHHPTPPLSSVAREELWTAALAARYLWVPLGLFTLVTLVIFSDTDGQVSPPVFAPRMLAGPAAVLALLVSYAIWRREQPARRAYFHSMPVRRFPHHLSRNLAGWMWTMAGTAVLHLWGAAAHWVINARLGDFPAWQWAVPAVAATAAYLIAATVSTASNHPLAWMFGAYLASPFLFRVPLFRALVGGEYGMSSLAGGVRDVGGDPSLVAWLITVALWITVPMVGLFAASRFYREV